MSDDNFCQWRQSDCSELARLRAEVEKLREERNGHYLTLQNVAKERDDAIRENGKLRKALNLALEYWAHRQQRYNNRSPAWVIAARTAMGDTK